jgi:SAM-dependent methyltransferase
VSGTAGAEAWRDDNRAHWDERVDLHLAAPEFYDLTPLREGRGRLNALEESELGPVAGLRVLHLQCHFGRDSLILAQRGADVTGVDFSPRAIAAARSLSVELGLSQRARFVLSDVYDAPAALARSAAFDLVYVTWGAITWLPDIAGWARVVAGFLRPGGALYLAEGHPVAFVFDDAARLPDGRPGYYVPYFLGQAYTYDDDRDYANPNARLRNTRQHSFLHPLGAVTTALVEAGMRLQWLREHDTVTWRMFACLVEGTDGMFRWAEKPWLPLSFSLRAVRT